MGLHCLHISPKISKHCRGIVRYRLNLLRDSDRSSKKCHCVNLIALSTAKTPLSFGCSECNTVNTVAFCIRWPEIEKLKGVSLIGYRGLNHVDWV